MFSFQYEYSAFVRTEWCLRSPGLLLETERDCKRIHHGSRGSLTTGAMQMVADCFPWTEASSFMYSRDNHTSVVGMREIASQAGAATMCVHNLSQGKTAYPNTENAGSPSYCSKGLLIQAPQTYALLFGTLFFRQ